MLLPSLSSLSAELLDFIVATVECNSSPQGKAEAYYKLDVLAERHIETLRKRTKQLQDARLARSDEQLASALRDYDEALEVS